MKGRINFINIYGQNRPSALTSNLSTNGLVMGHYRSEEMFIIHRHNHRHVELDKIKMTGWLYRRASRGREGVNEPNRCPSKAIEKCALEMA